MQWTVEPEWKGETCFIVCGGTSVTDEMLDSIKGRRCIAVNSSYRSAPWADILFFADARWWEREVKDPLGKVALDKFKGIICTVSSTAMKNASPLSKRIKRLRRAKVLPDGLSPKPWCATVERTSMQAAMNIAMHRGVKRIVLLGADNRDGANGRAHHHPEYPWKRTQKGYTDKLENLKHAAPVLKKRGIEVINCSPISTIPFWPIRPLEEVLRAEAD